MSKNSATMKIIGYGTYGFPSVELSEAFFRALLEVGFSGVEVGVPFSDPVADGPVIQEAHRIALENGVEVSRVLDFARRLRAEFLEKEIYVMAYLNTLARFGFDALPEVSGYIVPDLPVCEYEENRFPFKYVPLLSPNSPEKDIAKSISLSPPFVYLVSLYGTTGSDFPRDIETLKKISARLRREGVKVYVGFGIDSYEKVKKVLEFADAAVIGTHLLKVLFSSGLAGVVEEAKILLGNP